MQYLYMSSAITSLRSDLLCVDSRCTRGRSSGEILSKLGSSSLAIFVGVGGGHFFCAPSCVSGLVWSLLLCLARFACFRIPTGDTGTRIWRSSIRGQRKKVENSFLATHSTTCTTYSPPSWIPSIQ